MTPPHHAHQQKLSLCGNSTRGSAQPQKPDRKQSSVLPSKGKACREGFTDDDVNDHREGGRRCSETKYPKLTPVLVSAGEPGLPRTNDALAWKHKIKEQVPDWKWRWSRPEKEELGSEWYSNGHAVLKKRLSANTLWEDKIVKCLQIYTTLRHVCLNFSTK